jgi:aminocarboxymuconate-semialdehyde decarboxylase
MHARMDRQAQGDVALNKPSDYAARFAYDSILHAGKPLRFLADLVGIDRIMLGTDYSFPPADLSPLTTLRQAGFGPREIEQIAVQNPRRMFHCRSIVPVNVQHARAFQLV